MFVLCQLAREALICYANWHGYAKVGSFFMLGLFGNNSSTHNIDLSPSHTHDNRTIISRQMVSLLQAAGTGLKDRLLSIVLRFCHHQNGI